MRHLIFYSVTYISLGLLPSIAFCQDIHYQLPNSERVVSKNRFHPLNDPPGKNHILAHYLIPKKYLANGLPAGGETPASVACIYGLTPYVTGCPISLTTVPSGGWGVIAVTEGGHDPNAEAELAAFSTQFHLPQCTSSGSNPCFQEFYATSDGLRPPDAKGNALFEHALDIEWAHAMAPNAKIIMVEANSFEQPDIFNAVALANQKVQAMGGGLISNSWGASEYVGETAYDSLFQIPGIVYVVSSGDDFAPANYPAASPYVVSVGGTMFIRNQAGQFVQEVGWNQPDVGGGDASSGGPSAYEPRPSYQDVIQKIVGNARGTPDFSSVASNVDVYIVNDKGVAEWVIGYGTSISAPTLAGIINTANSRATSSAQELSILYTGAIKNYHAYWHDIISGNNGYPCLQGYDFMTGFGTVLGYNGK